MIIPPGNKYNHNSNNITPASIPNPYNPQGFFDFENEEVKQDVKKNPSVTENNNEILYNKVIDGKSPDIMNRNKNGNNKNKNVSSGNENNLYNPNITPGIRHDNMNGKKRILDSKTNVPNKYINNTKIPPIMPKIETNKAFGDDKTTNSIKKVADDNNIKEFPKQIPFANMNFTNTIDRNPYLLPNSNTFGWNLKNTNPFIPNTNSVSKAWLKNTENVNELSGGSNRYQGKFSLNLKHNLKYYANL